VSGIGALGICEANVYDHYIGLFLENLFCGASNDVVASGIWSDAVIFCDFCNLWRSDQFCYSCSIFLLRRLDPF
jgi:hypothetical protein